METNTVTSGNMGILDRGIRMSVGLAVLISALHMSINSAEAYAYTKVFASIVVLTGIVGWDPFYAMFRNIVARMTRLESVTFSTGNIGLADRAVRIVLGLGMLLTSLHFTIGGVDIDPLVKIFAAIVVLTGIAGWDPLYASFRSLASRIRNAKLNQSLAHPPLSYR